METTQQILTHSRMSCFRTCPRKHYLRYELGLTPVKDEAPRRVGSAFHALLEAVDKGAPTTVILDQLEDDFEREMVLAMFDGHMVFQGEAEKSIIPQAAELEFDIPLVNPDTGKPTPIWRFCGKIDRIVRIVEGRLAIMEYKTTSRDFSPGAEYWQNLHMDMQLSIYIIAARELGYNIDTVLYDVTRRPALRPLKATPADVRKYTKDGKLYANQRAEDETPEAYGERVRADIASRPEHYFARIEVARLEQDLDDCRAEIWQQQQAIREAQKSHRWYRNPNSCYGMFSCDYLPVCMFRDLETRTPDGYIRSTNINPELGAPAGSE
jgi:RecB family exonuclease